MLAKDETPMQIRLHRGFLLAVAEQRRNEAGAQASETFAPKTDDSGIVKGCDDSFAQFGLRAVNQVRLYVYKVGSSLISSLILG